MKKGNLIGTFAKIRSRCFKLAAFEGIFTMVYILGEVIVGEVSEISNLFVLASVSILRMLMAAGYVFEFLILALKRKKGEKFFTSIQENSSDFATGLMIGVAWLLIKLAVFVVLRPGSYRAVFIHPFLFDMTEEVSDILIWALLMRVALVTLKFYPQIEEGLHTAIRRYKDKEDSST